MSNWLGDASIPNSIEAGEEEERAVKEKEKERDKEKEREAWAGEQIRDRRRYAGYDFYVSASRKELASRDENDLAIIASRDGKSPEYMTEDDFAAWESELVAHDYERQSMLMDDSLDPVVVQCLRIRNDLRSLERNLSKIPPNITSAHLLLNSLLLRIEIQLSLLDVSAMEKMQLGQRFKLPTHDGSNVQGQFDPREILPYPKSIYDCESFDTRNIEFIISEYSDMVASESKNTEEIARVVQRTGLGISGFIKSQIFRTRNEISLLRRICLEFYPQMRLERIGPISSEEQMGWAVYLRRPAEDLLSVPGISPGVYIYNSQKLSLWTLTPGMRNGEPSWIYPVISWSLGGNISPRMGRIDDPPSELGNQELNAIKIVLSALETKLKARDSLARELVIEHLGVPNRPYYSIYSRIAIQTKHLWGFGKPSARSRITKIAFFVESKLDHELYVREHICRETTEYLKQEIEKGLLARLDAEETRK